MYSLKESVEHAWSVPCLKLKYAKKETASSKQNL